MTPQVTPEGAIVPPGGFLSPNDLHYLESIKRQLDDTLKFIRRKQDFGILLGIEILADNIDWLDCFIEQRGRQMCAQEHVKADSAPSRARDAR